MVAAVLWVFVRMAWPAASSSLTPDWTQNLIQPSAHDGEHDLRRRDVSPVIDDQSLGRWRARRSRRTGSSTGGGRRVRRLPPAHANPSAIPFWSSLRLCGHWQDRAVTSAPGHAGVILDGQALQGPLSAIRYFLIVG